MRREKRGEGGGGGGGRRGEKMREGFEEAWVMAPSNWGHGPGSSDDFWTIDPIAKNRSIYCISFFFLFIFYFNRNTESEDSFCKNTLKP